MHKEGTTATTLPGATNLAVVTISRSPTHNPFVINVSAPVMAAVLASVRPKALAGAALAQAMMHAQLPMGPRLDIVKGEGTYGLRKPNSRERRAAKIAAGRLIVVDGALIGA